MLSFPTLTSDWLVHPGSNGLDSFSGSVRLGLGVGFSGSSQQYQSKYTWHIENGLMAVLWPESRDYAAQFLCKGSSRQAGFLSEIYLGRNILLNSKFTLGESFSEGLVYNNRENLIEPSPVCWHLEAWGRLQIQVLQTELSTICWCAIIITAYLYTAS